MGKIKDIPINNRPREKAIRIGVENLSDAELLAIIIQSGTKDYSAIEIANLLLTNYKSLDNVLEASMYSLSKIKGISKVKSLLILSIKELFKRYNNALICKTSLSLNSLYEVYDYVYLKFDKLIEKIIVLYLNNKNVLLYEQVVSIGDETSSILNNKLILKTSVEKYAKKVILIHNHPSGIPKPSSEDLKAYNNLFKILKLINVTLLDSIIIGKSSFFSILNNLEYKV